MITTAYSYIRFSTAEQRKGSSLKSQQEDSRIAAEKHGWTLDESFRDLGVCVSAFKGDHKATGDLGRFLKAVQYGKVRRGSVLIVESLDRLSREDVPDFTELPFLHKPEYQFLIRVVFKCWLLFGENPVKLMHRARSSDHASAIDSLRKLASVDAAVLCDPRIMQRVRRLQQEGQFLALDDVFSAMAKPVMFSKRFKITIAAMIWKQAAIMKHRITTPEIRRLFDAVAKDRGGLRDFDLLRGGDFERR